MDHLSRQARPYLISLSHAAIFGVLKFFVNHYNNVKSNISEQTNYLQSKFTIIQPQNYKMSPLRGITLAGLAKKYTKNGGVRKANFMKFLPLHIP
jgi:flagellar capping protein FliD